MTRTRVPETRLPTTRLLQRPFRRWALLVLLLPLAFVAGCQTTASEVGGLAATPPLDYAVLVTGGTFLTPDGAGPGTFLDPPSDDGAAAVTRAGDEVIAIEDVVALLRRSRVFRRVAIDSDSQRRQLVARSLAATGTSPELTAVLRQARDEGYDYVLVLEEVQDGPLDAQGINGRWPVTFATWILLGVGALIPDHTFESRASLRVTLRELQAGRALHDPVLVGGPIDLALTERTDLLGLVMSILVPPFWVGSDREAVVESIRGVTRRRLLLSLARDLKSESVRRRLRDGSAAGVTLVETREGPMIEIDSAESLSRARLRGEPAFDAAAAEAFAAELLGSLQAEGGRFRYRARLPDGADRRLVQVLVATIGGAVASATFEPGDPR
ncbi:MAG: hypothetical protein NXI31_19125 [bacterium]|nr:hypothetical protein [bacterium]